MSAHFPLMLAICRRIVSFLCLFVGWYLLFPVNASAAPGKKEIMQEGLAKAGEVSYYKDIRPVFQAKCQGCHQPAKAKGDYVMTDVAKLIAGGETGPAVDLKKPHESLLIEQVTPVDGEVEMPPKGKEDPLTKDELKLVGNWIAQGAKDDTPVNAREVYDMDHPPKYAVPPVITSLDYSPDGKLLAVAGFHEVLLHKADGSGLVARLVGLSERIESVRFSPDGKLLAVTGGLPARMGEVQIWDVAKRKLKQSVPVGFDTLYGGSWSPDGKTVAFGMTDNTVRAINVGNGKQVLFMGGHSDWALDTVFSSKGTHLVSVGRDMSAKLTEVKTERFVDNITSITPKALKGGIASVTRHPSKDEILVGGSDGIPQIYRMIRQTARRIGDNANLIRQFPEMQGRIWGTAYSPDGKRIATGSSLNGKGWINIYAADFESKMPELVKTAFGKVATTRTAEEKKAVEDYYTKDVKLLHSVEFPQSTIFALAFSPDGKTVAAAGDDGKVRLINAAGGTVAKAFVPVKIAGADAVAKTTGKNAAGKVPVNLKKGKHGKVSQSSLPKGRKAVGLAVVPAVIKLDSPNVYNQLLVTAKLDSGDSVDLTREVKWSLDKDLLQIDDKGVARPKTEGQATLTVKHGALSVSVPVTVTGLKSAAKPDFIRDVSPVINRLGCSAGTCHGAKAGKMGFKLSLRGYDPLYDVRAFGDDHTARRVNYASPDDSLMLMKATGAVPHEGGALTDIHSDYYKVIRQWIADGAELDLEKKKVMRIELFPKMPVIQNIGGSQQIRVVGYYADGSQRDVTQESYIESGNKDVATHDNFGLISTLRRGEAPVLARYEGAYAATTITVMGDRTGFKWTKQPSQGRVDELVAAKWQRMKIQPSGLCTDAEFVRRVYLDLTGLPPGADEVRKFIADKQPTRQKRDKLIDVLIGSPEFVDHWTNKWADMLQVNSKFLGKEGAQLFRDWIHTQVENNIPYDKFAYSILTAKGSNMENPAASYFKVLREPTEIMENTTHLFLATRFNCNKCHDHPFERWNQDQYYETAAYFARVSLVNDTKNSKNRRIGGSAVEGAKPLFEMVADKKEGDVKHGRTGTVTAPKFPYRVNYTKKKGATRREELAAWMVSPDNQYFAKSYANRIWGYMLGRGVIEPLDDIRAGNPPTNPELLDYLTEQFIGSGFDVRKLMTTVCKSRTYQLSLSTNQWNADDEINYSHAIARRLPAEVIFDSLYKVTGSIPNIPGAKPGMRAAQIADARTDLPSGILASLGRPVRESACECERANDVQLGTIMTLVSGPTIADAIADPGNALVKLVASQTDDKKVFEEVFLRVLNRKPTEGELKAVLESMSEIEVDHKGLVAKLAEKEAKMVPIRAEKERQRLIAMQQAKAGIASYTPEYNKKKSAAETEQKKRIVVADKAIKDYAPKQLAAMKKWESELPVNRLWTKWIPLTPKTVKASGGINLKTQPDGSVIASGSLKPSDYTITVDSKLAGITGVMIEALPDDSLPGFGPGLNANGNFVLTELKLSSTSKKSGSKAVNAKFVDAKADVNQKSFSVKNTINGNLRNNDKAWAVAGSERQPHWARFKLEKPLGDSSGSSLTFSLICRYSKGDYPLGKFRIWVTTSSQPLELGLPQRVVEAVKTAPSQRSEQQAVTLAAYHRGIDVEGLKLRQKLIGEKRPLPGDPKMVVLKAVLSKAEIAVPKNGALVQLRQDVEMSIEQAAKQRLTAAQDLTWALINNPSFLFNH